MFVFTCVSDKCNEEASSYLLERVRYFPLTNWFSNCESCWDVNAVRGLLALDKIETFLSSAKHYF